MKNRRMRWVVRWGATLGGFVFGAAMNALAVAAVLSHLPIGLPYAVLVTIVVIPAGGVVCGGMAGRWANRHLEGRE